MAAQRRAGTSPEIAVRRALHSMGLRYRVGLPVQGMPRRSIDIAFTRAKVAVFIAGCFWHSCPLHGVDPKNNAAWWADKLAENRRRDAETQVHLEGMGWTVLRFWEHEAVTDIASIIRDRVTSGASPNGLRP
jgi:DNA mismatch endonuclease (patch repair protein)